MFNYIYITLVVDPNIITPQGPTLYLQWPLLIMEGVIGGRSNQEHGKAFL